MTKSCENLGMFSRVYKIYIDLPNLVDVKLSPLVQTKLFQIKEI